MPPAKKDSTADEQPVTTSAAAQPQEAAAPEAPKPGKFDNELGQFKDFRPSLIKDMGYLPDQDPRFVQNVPADMTVSWATDPRLDAGQHLSIMQSLGFRMVRSEEVTTKRHAEDKLLLRAYEVGPHDAVVVGGGVLMIGYRQYRDDRRAFSRAQAKERLDAQADRLDNQNVEQRVRSRSASLSEVM